MDIRATLENLERVRLSLSIQASETKEYWNDNMRFIFYSNVVEYYNPKTINFVEEFRQINEKFESWLYELRQM